MQNNIKLIFSNLYSTTVFLNSISALIHGGLRKHSADGQGKSGQYKNEPATERDCCHGRFIVSMADTGGNAHFCSNIAEYQLFVILALTVDSMSIPPDNMVCLQRGSTHLTALPPFMLHICRCLSNYFLFNDCRNPSILTYTIRQNGIHCFAGIQYVGWIQSAGAYV